MKKVYLACLSFLAVGAFAQENTGTIEYTPASTDQHVNQRPTLLGESRAADDIIWSHDFTTTTDWTAAGGDANNGWTIGTTTNGWYFPGSGNMGTTGEFARLAVENPSTITSGPLTLTYNAVLPDLTGIPAPHLEFEMYGARFITIQEVQVSTDGGSNWLTASSNADIEPLTQGGGSVYGQPETRRFNIQQQISGNPANVMIRLFWDGDLNGGNMNYIDYGWFIDDIRVVEGHSYDMEADQAYFVSGTEQVEYYMVPTTQLTGIEFSAEGTNQGGSTFEGLYLEATVDMGGNVFTGTSPTVDLAPTLSDSLVSSTLFTPANGVGTYNFTWTLLGDSVDTYNANNAMTDAIEVTNTIYSRDNDVSTGSINNIVGNDGSPMGIGNTMEFFAAGTVGAIDIHIGDGNPQDLIYARVDIYNAGSMAFDFVDQTADYSLEAGDIGGWVKLIFTNAISVNPGDLLLVTANHYGSVDVRFSYAQPTYENTVLGYDGGAALFGLASPNAIMIRTDMVDYTGIENSENYSFDIAQNYPNPFDNNSVITYTLEEGAEVSVQFTDVSGKVIKTINQGNQAAGTYQIEVDGSDFAAGTYFYTFTIGDQKVAKKMTVK